MKIVIPEHIDILSKEHLQHISSMGQVTTYNENPLSETELIERLKGAEIAIVEWLILPERVIENLSNLKFVITLSSGYEHLPLNSMRKRNIIAINCPTFNSLAVAEHTFALLFALTHKIIEANMRMQEGFWKVSPYSFQSTELTGKTITIIGKGNIGKHVIEMAHGFGMHVFAADSKTTTKQLEHLLNISDIVSLHIRYTPLTHHLFNKTKLFQMKKGSLLINTSRGTIIDQTALIEIVKSGHLGGVALDVYENEPIFTTALPEEIKELASLPHVITTPHIASNTKEAAARLGKELIENLQAIISGTPLNVVGK